jgi:hypothetical protein
MPDTGGYRAATRHPLPCLLFVFPLVVAYEVGVQLLGGDQPGLLRNGADAWLRAGHPALGGSLFWIPPSVLILFFLIWSWRRRADRPKGLVDVLSGMILESVAFALLLWGLGRALPSFLQSLPDSPSTPTTAAPGRTATLRSPAMQIPNKPREGPGATQAGSPLARVVTYLGAGIYEETIFRLFLFSVLLGLLRWLDLGGFLSVTLAALGSAALFSAAHHLGSQGQPYSNALFLFRLTAGLYFAWLYHTRGFGIAVGTHACYNVMVSLQ